MSSVKRELGDQEKKKNIVKSDQIQQERTVKMKKRKYKEESFLEKSLNQRERERERE